MEEKEMSILRKKLSFYVLFAFLIILSLAIVRPDRLFTRGRQRESHISGVTESKILVIGLDGATWKLIDPLLEQGKLPNLKLLMEKGCFAELKTFSPCISPVIWTSIATGKLPDKHGIWGFFEEDPESTELFPSTSNRRKVKAFWNILNEYGKSTGILNWWVTWPAEKVDGYVVSDFIQYYPRMERILKEEISTKYDVYPESLADRLKPFIHRPDEIKVEEVHRFMRLNRDETKKYLAKIGPKINSIFFEFVYAYQLDKSMSEIGLYLLENHPTDILAIYFGGIDVVSHIYWHFMEPSYFKKYEISDDEIKKFGGVIRNYYIWMDEVVGSFLSRVKKDTSVIILSDHGFGPTGTLPWSGGHSKTHPGAPVAPDGILIMSGKNINQEAVLKEPRVIDITPTILALMKVPLAQDMDGRVLVEALTPEFIDEHPLSYISSFEDRKEFELKKTQEESLPAKEELLDKLKALGYIQ
jgi:predicted AlkP superfamily phosphohydrolase/phosphomutase